MAKLVMILFLLLLINSIYSIDVISKVKPFFPIIGFYAVMNLPIYGIGM